MLRTGRKLIKEDIAIHVLTVGCIDFVMKPADFVNVSTYFETAM